MKTEIQRGIFQKKKKKIQRGEIQTRTTQPSRERTQLQRKVNQQNSKKKKKKKQIIGTVNSEYHE